MSSRLIRTIVVCAAVAAAATFNTVRTRAVSPNVIISQVYGGGGNSGATHHNDFIELYNASATAVNLTGWSVQYASASGSSWTNITSLSGTIQPHGYFLVQEAAGSGGGAALPTPDVTGSINMSGTAGKVALVSSTTALTGACPTGGAIVDFVGFGSANCAEGATAPAPSNSTSIIRAVVGGDTDANNVDFVVSDPPNPRNSSVSNGDPTGVGEATPASVQTGQTSVLTVTVTPGTNPASTNITVKVDLSQIGGSATQALFDDGTHGDATANDRTYAFTATAMLPAGATPGAKSLPVTVADAQGRSTTTAIALTVTLPPPPAADIVISQVYGGGGNAGATLTNDFIELFNREAFAVPLDGWSVQYASSSGTSWQVTPLTGTIPAGGYYLVQEAQGSGGTQALPAPDATGTIAMASGSGKVALANTTSALTGGCPLSFAIDLVGYGSANCFEGNGAVTALGNTTAAVRKDDATLGKQDTNDNANDFDRDAPAPHNHSGIVPQGTGAANPNGVEPGETTTLTVAVSRGQNPTSTNITVVADLTSIGGPASQTLFDDGSNGDATSGDLTFSFTTAVSGAPGTRSIPFTVSDAEGRTATGTIALSILGAPIAIHDIQGSGSASPLTGQFVTTTGIVTAVRPSSFYIQAAPQDYDADATTSEGLLVFLGSGSSSNVQRGDLVRVAGVVTEFRPSADPGSPSLTELNAPIFTKVVATGTALPDPVTLTADMMSPSGNFEQLERFEGMRVTGNFTAISGTASFSRTTTDEVNNTSASNGQFYVVITGTPRPLREPGIAPDENPPANPPAHVPYFDGDPEKLRVDSGGQIGASRIEIVAGQQLPNLTGVLDYGFRSYTVVPDPAPWAPVGSDHAVAVPDPGANEFTIASFNTERFYDDVTDGYNEEVVLTAQAFQDRLSKASLAIRHVMKSPDVIGLEEVENLNALTQLANRVNADAAAETGVNPGYQPYLFEGNDIGGIDVGILVKSTRVSVVDVQQVGKDTVFAYDGSLLNDRPSVFMKAIVTAPNGVTYPITFVVNHLRSLSSIDSPTDGDRVRHKRAAQAEFLATQLQAHQAENLVSVGDYNAFQLNDGWVDVMGTLVGTPAPGDQVVVPTTADLVNPHLTMLDNTLGSQQYSFLFDGIAQAIDHVLVNPAMKLRFTRIAYARNDVDFPESLRSDPTRPERISDHDMPVAYFSFPGAPSIALTGPSDVTVECCSPFPTPSASDVTIVDDYPVTLTITGSVDGTHVGTYQVTYTADNGFLTSSVTRTVHVVDTTAPAIAGLSVTPSVIGVPNHKMVDVDVRFTATDATGAPACSASVASNEAVNGLGDGNTGVDWDVVNEHHVRVRAERSGVGSGRVYTVTVTCSDAYGNTSTAQTGIQVPK